MVMRPGTALRDELSLRDLELLFDVYAAARHVEATMPEGDLARIAASKIIASFHREIDVRPELSTALH